MHIFGHSKFIPVFLGKIVRKNSEWPFLAIPNLYQSFCEKLLAKIQNGNFWPFQIYTSLFGKNCQIKFRMAILAIPNLYQFFWKNCWKKIRSAIFGHSEFIPVFLGKFLEKLGIAIFGHPEFMAVFLGKIVGKNLEWPFFAFLNFF